MEAVKPFELPPAPRDQTGPVKAWAEAVVISTYAPMRPDKNPMFLETRVYQGSSGGVYPLPFIDRISTDPENRSWQAVHLENEFLRVMVLPEIGGRIHVGLDKTNGYDFFYRQNVIKPALVGLAGPWISGGVEFNWPQHHRPATFMPVSFTIEAHADGSQTVWCSDHDPIGRMKGMHGVCLRPGKAYIELKVRLYNRTPFVQTFLWWANVAVRVHELYQSFFPPDVHYVADHAKRATSTFPLCEGTYYGVDYGARARNGVPVEELPRCFVPDGSYPANDLGWYANIPVPTSYMAVGSHEDFFGGYDHAREAGLVHVANHHIASGKKQWTWGNHDFGYAWDRNLTDGDGPYIELMAGVFTDNQPDFSFLAPGETKIFSQYWYPIQKIGPVQKANIDAAVSLRAAEGSVRIGVCVSRMFAQALVRLEFAGKVVGQWTSDLFPGAPWIRQVELFRGATEADLALSVHAPEGREIIRYTPKSHDGAAAVVPATEPAVPKDIEGNDELYLTGLHLDQYRHATRQPEVYWQEALRRDPSDSRCNNAMGLWHLRRGEFQKAEQHFRAAIATITRRNPNPYDSEPYYNLGVTLRYLDRDDEAYDAFYKATWSYAWRGASFHGLAEVEAKRGNWSAAAEHLNRALRVNADNLNARNLAAIVLRKLGNTAESQDMLRGTLALDPLDQWAAHLARGMLAGDKQAYDNQVLLDITFDYARAGLYSTAIQLLSDARHNRADGSAPIILYALGYFQFKTGAEAESAQSLREAALACPDYCFPSRLEELIVLEAALKANPDDARAAYYLGNLLYDKRRNREGITCWERSAKIDPSFPTVWRNLGIGYYNILGNSKKAVSAFNRALNANAADARVLYERDQLWKRVGIMPATRLAEIENHRSLVQQRDDLSVELATLYNHTGQPGKAVALLASRTFQPWEGGRGLR